MYISLFNTYSPYSRLVFQLEIKKKTARHNFPASLHSIQAPTMHNKNATRVSGRHRSNKLLGDSPVVRNMRLQTRRLRRLCRPFFPIIARAFIVIFTAIELRPITDHLGDDLITPFLSRFGVLAGFIASLFSVIFFDVRVFNFVVLAVVFLKFLLDLHAHQYTHIHHLMASMSFHSTAILFSALVGRRRSISKPSALLSATCHKSFYARCVKTLRNIDVLEAGTRLQASLLALDYSLSRRTTSTQFFFTLPFAVLFFAGYGTQRNGAILLMLLIGFSVVNETSPVLGFNFAKTISTVSGALLGIIVGPGQLTVDEWMANTKQLCY